MHGNLHGNIETNGVQNSSFASASFALVYLERFNPEWCFAMRVFGHMAINLVVESSACNHKIYDRHS
jgi:hypothetical protein